MDSIPQNVFPNHRVPIEHVNDKGFGKTIGWVITQNVGTLKKDLSDNIKLLGKEKGIKYKTYGME